MTTTGGSAPKGGSNYLYDPIHPHAVQSPLGWGYTYNQNGDVVTRTKGANSYTFTYTDFLKVETISRNGQVLHRFGYDANGRRVAERRSDGTLVFFVGESSEYSVPGNGDARAEVLRQGGDAPWMGCCISS